MWNFFVQTLPMTLLLGWMASSFWFWALRERRLGKVLTRMKFDDRIALMALQKEESKVDQVSKAVWSIVPGRWMIWFVVILYGTLALSAAPSAMTRLLFNGIGVFYIVLTVILLILMVWRRLSFIAPMRKYPELKAHVFFETKLTALECLFSMACLGAMLWWVKR